MENQNETKLEEQGNSISPLLPAVGERIRFKKTVVMEGRVCKIVPNRKDFTMILMANECEIILPDGEFTAYGIREGEFTNCR